MSEKQAGNEVPTLLDSVSRVLKSHSPAARIERLRKHKSLQERADELDQWLNELGGHANAVLLLAIQTAEEEALRVDVGPKVERDYARQVGTRQKRGNKMPKLDAWLDKQDLTLTCDKLWALLPDDSESDADIYRDGEQVCENHSHISSRSEHTVTHHSKRDGFDKRVTAARKRRKPR
ncbi:MAG TPA: hypothetical protein VJR95_12775 [Rhodanobacter sp.]|nr:hypothetical protein [Rhodanobacter sp.]